MHCLYGGPLFDGVHLHSQGYVCMDKGKIAGFGPGSPLEWTGTSQDVQGRLNSPGFIDLHSYALEKCVDPRPRAVFDHQMALQGLDCRLAASGVTSFCHAVAFLDEDMGLRSPFTAADMIRSIQDFHVSDRAHVRHKVHIRFEVGGTLSAQVIREVLKAGDCALFSVMDHSPGQGQFKSLKAFINYFAAAYALSEQEVQAGCAWAQTRTLWLLIQHLPGSVWSRPGLEGDRCMPRIEQDNKREDWITERYMQETQFLEQDMTREQWLPALACLSAVELRTAVMPILDSYELEHQALPEDGLGLLQVQDGAWGQAFYLGEFPLASAHIILRTPQGREFPGAAQYLGDKKEKAVYMAVCDAVLANNLPEEHVVWDLVSAGKKKREEIKRQRQAIISRTRVDFDLVSPVQGGTDVD